MSLIGRLGPLGVVVTVGRSALHARRHWRSIPADRRERLQTLIKRSGGRPSGLDPNERQELAGLVRELRLGELGRVLAMTAVGARGRRGRR